MENKRRRWLVVLLAAALFCGTVWLLLPAREPRYHGQPLSHWLYAPVTDQVFFFSEEQWSPGSSRSLHSHEPFPVGEDRLTAESSNAVEAAGVKAIPTLLRMLRARDSDLKLRLLKLVGKQHFIKITPTPALLLNFRGREGLALLGSKASNAVPTLIKICDENISESSHLYALDALGWIGPAASNAIPALLRGVNSTNILDPGIDSRGLKGSEEDRIAALYSLAEIHQHPEVVIPALFKAMQNPDVAVHEAAAHALTGYGPEASMAVQPCLPVFKDLDYFTRLSVFNALMDIAPDFAAQLPDARAFVKWRVDAVARGYYSKANEAFGLQVVAGLGACRAIPDVVVPALTSALQDRSINIRREAANALAKFGKDARPALPALTQALTDTNQDSNGVPVSVFAACALKIIDSASATNANINTLSQP